MLQFQSFWVFRFWISNGRDNFLRILSSWGPRGSMVSWGTGVPRSPGDPGSSRGHGAPKVPESQNWVPLFYHAPFTNVFQNRFSKKFHNTHMKTPVLALADLLLQNTYGGCFWIFATANTFFQLNLVFLTDSRTAFTLKSFENTS